MGADFAYMGTRFIASEEANASAAYKNMIVDANASDILYTPYFTGIPGNYLKASITASGLDPEHLPAADVGAGFGADRIKPWKDVWGAGQGVGAVQNVAPVSTIVDSLHREYSEALNRLKAEAFV